MQKDIEKAMLVCLYGTQRCQVRKNLTKHRRNQNAVLNHIRQTYMALFTFSGMYHSRYLREKLTLEDIY